MPALPDTLLFSLYEHTSDAVFVTSTNRRIRHVNPAFSSLFGYSEAEIGGVTLSALYAEKSVFDASDGDAGAPDLLYRTKSGSTFWGTLRLIPTQSGNQLLGIIRDVTGRRQLERRIEDGERLLREALGSGNQGAWRLSLAERKVEVTGPLATYLGFDGEEAVIPLADWRAMVHPEDQATALAAMSTVFRGKMASAEFRMGDGKGQYRWMLGRGRLNPHDNKRNVVTGLIFDVHQRKQLESQVEQSDRQLADALKAADLAAWRYDLKEHRATIRGDLAEQIGISQDDPEIAGPTWVERIHADDTKAVVSGTMAVARGETETFNVLYRVKDRAGEWRWIRSTGRLIQRDDTGKPWIAAGVLKDETRRIRLEMALKDEKDRYESVYRATPAMMHTIDADGIIVDVSDYWLSVLGYLRAEVIGKSPTEFLTDVDRERSLTQGLAEHWKTGRCENVPYTFIKKSGERVETLLSAVVETREDGAPFRSHAVLVDVTERNALESALREEKNRFETVYQASPAMMHTIAPDGRIIQVSDYWLAVMGYSRDEVIGRKSIEFLDNESRQRAVSETLPSLFATGSNTNVPYRFVRKNGETIDVLLSSFLERHEDGSPKASYAVVTDVTALRRAYDDLKRSNRELDRFAAIASHDLQEPLRKIAAFASLLSRRHKDSFDEDARRALHFMLDAALRMQSLIDELLNYSRLSNQPIRTASVDMHSVVAEAMSRLDSALAESGGCVCVGELAPVEGDYGIVVQILQNLISNAVKYRGKARPRIQVNCEAGPDMAVYSVTDNGVGFDPRFSEKVFAPFQRLHARGEYPGNGIGLAIVQQAVERHGGDVWVESTPGEGSAFHFSLPVARSARMHDEAAVA